MFHGHFVHLREDTPEQHIMLKYISGLSPYICAKMEIQTLETLGEAFQNISKVEAKANTMHKFTSHKNKLMQETTSKPMA